MWKFPLVSDLLHYRTLLHSTRMADEDVINNADG
jgi:hypothetical protein